MGVLHFGLVSAPPNQAGYGFVSFKAGIGVSQIAPSEQFQETR